MKALIILDYAPDYRETFLRKLSEKTSLTVIAQPCNQGNLTEPSERYGYEYLEIKSRYIFGMFWQNGLLRKVKVTSYDIIYVDFNIRHLNRLLLFLLNKKIWSKWIWRGHIFGRSQSFIVDLIRKFFLSRASACLVYSEKTVSEIYDKYGIKAISFNNTEVSRDDFKIARFSPERFIKVLFVGRNQKRKKLHRLISLAENRNDVVIRFVGNGMNQLNVPEHLKKEGRIKTYGHTTDIKLDRHFTWADIVASPGHVGLLVTNAARYGKAIVIDKNSHHAPEYWLAVQANQPFISFSNLNVVNLFFDSIISHRENLEIWGTDLQKVAKEKYTIENMVNIHLSAISIK